MINFKDFKNNIEDIGYYADEELLYDAYNAMCLFHDTKVSPGQDIFAICLEGPPGSGKTEFAKTYAKIASKIFKGNVELIEYQCDATTGKEELFEDINISAAIKRDAEHVNIPGKLIKAIDSVNKGKRVVLFIDEYDKAREETDAFLLQFLQSGKLNSTQHGDMEVKEQYKSRLQVILCKNDMREELSGPLSRRIRIIRLDYMRPEIFYKVANRTLVTGRKNPVNDSLINLVTLMYESAYESASLYKRLPSCSEMLIAIEDANRMLLEADAPQSVIYNIIIKNMFKSLDDINTFNSKIHTSNKEDDKKLASLIDAMKDEEHQDTVDLETLMSEKVFKERSQELNSRISELKSLIEEYQEKFKQMEAGRLKAIARENKRILIDSHQLVLNNKPLTPVGNFYDQTMFVKRGVSIFHDDEQDWVEIGHLRIPELSHEELISKMITYANNLNITIYEDGVQLLDQDGEQVIVLKNPDGTYSFMANTAVISSTSLMDIKNFIRFALQVLINQYRKNPLTSYGDFDINALIYNDDTLPLDVVRDNIYTFSKHFELDPDRDEFGEMIKDYHVEDHSKVIAASDRIMSGPRKELKNE